MHLLSAPYTPLRTLEHPHTPFHALSLHPHPLQARDAAAARAEKFLDEFVGFRESAHLWCLLPPGGYQDAAVAVPAWAREQLRTPHAGATTPSLAALEVR